MVCRSLAPSSSSSFARPLAQSATAAASPSPALPRPKRERKPGLSLAHSFPDHGEEDDERNQADEGRAEGLRVGDHGAHERTEWTCERSRRLRQMPPPSRSAAEPAAASGEVLPSTVTNTLRLADSIKPVCATLFFFGK